MVDTNVGWGYLREFDGTDRRSRPLYLVDIAAAGKVPTEIAGTDVVTEIVEVVAVVAGGGLAEVAEVVDCSPF